MKEYGIRKLKNILNEYEDYKEEKHGKRNYKWICYGKENPRISADRTEGEGVDNCLYEDESRAVIISKGYNFIKRLIEKDKIDSFQLAIYIEYHSDYRFVANRELRDKNVDEDHLLMLLSIQDKPIEFLCSVLK